jgi:hypothetical protein
MALNMNPDHSAARADGVVPGYSTSGREWQPRRFATRLAQAYRSIVIEYRKHSREVAFREVMRMLITPRIYCPVLPGADFELVPMILSKYRENN